MHIRSMGINFYEIVLPREKSKNYHPVYETRCTQLYHNVHKCIYNNVVDDTLTYYG